MKRSYVERESRSKPVSREKYEAMKEKARLWYENYQELKEEFEEKCNPTLVQQLKDKISNLERDLILKDGKILQLEENKKDLKEMYKDLKADYRDQQKEYHQRLTSRT